MQERQLYLGLSVLGALVPLWSFGQWLMLNGLDTEQFFMDLSANKISLFAWLDVIISAVVLLLTCWRSEFNLSLPQQIGVTLATCCIGVSCGLPLLLYFWQPSVDRHKKADSA